MFNWFKKDKTIPRFVPGDRITHRLTGDSGIVLEKDTTAYNGTLGVNTRQDYWAVRFVDTEKEMYTVYCFGHELEKEI
jgi:hypothetical protein